MDNLSPYSMTPSDELLELEEREMIVARKALEQAEKAAALKILEKANIIGACDIAKVVFEADGEVWGRGFFFWMFLGIRPPLASIYLTC